MSLMKEYKKREQLVEKQIEKEIGKLEKPLKHTKLVSEYEFKGMNVFDYLLELVHSGTYFYLNTNEDEEKKEK